MSRLPNHPSYISDDRLGVVENPGDTEITHERVLNSLLQKAIEEIYAEKYYSEQPDDIIPRQPEATKQLAKAHEIFARTIRDIAYSLHHNGTLDTSRLESLLKTCTGTHGSIADFDSLLGILNSARPSELPFDELPDLSTVGNWGYFNGDIVNALLAHQMLGTLSQPAGNTWGLPCFISLYADTEASHPQAVKGYLKTLFHHFANPYGPSEHFSFSTYAPNSTLDPATCTTIPDFTIELLSQLTEPSTTTDPTPFVLVSANSQPGPGPTATQEERLTAASPALALTALLAPVIPDPAVIITSPFPVHASWEGHNRSARLTRLYEPTTRPRRHYILADALPLDEMERPEDGALRDLRPEYVLREVRKLCAAFSATAMYRDDARSKCVVEAPPWGCGSFGGDLVVKGMCMMVAAGLADVKVVLSVTEDRKDEAMVLRRLVERKLGVSKIWETLMSDNAQLCKSYEELLKLNEEEPDTKE